MSGIKHDQNKAPLALLPTYPLTAIAEILEFGRIKYAKDNWRGGFDYTRLVSACLRHLLAWNEGQDNDPESGKSHLAHAACCLLFLLEMEHYKTGKDDRWKGYEQK